jgi:hypothetical protein
MCNHAPKRKAKRNLKSKNAGKKKEGIGSGSGTVPNKCSKMDAC